jgi:hypothetical protein
MMSDGAAGGCLCGATRFRFTGEPLALSVCHCRSCRRASGAASVAWTVVRTDAFAFIAGSPTTFRSSPAVRRTFCPACGTPLTYQHDDSPLTIDIATATLDDPDAFAPTCEIWLSQRIRWASVDPSLPHYPTTKANADAG